MPDSIARKIKDIQAYYIVDVNMDDIGDYVDYYRITSYNVCYTKLLRVRAGMNYVSCSPFRVPIARLAAAQAALR